MKKKKKRRLFLRVLQIKTISQIICEHVCLFYIKNIWFWYLIQKATSSLRELWFGLFIWFGCFSFDRGWLYISTEASSQRTKTYSLWKPLDFTRSKVSPSHCKFNLLFHKHTQVSAHSVSQGSAAERPGPQSDTRHAPSGRLRTLCDW